MAKSGLLQTACTIAIFAAVPAFAQSNTPTGDTGPGGVPNAPTTHEAMPGGTMSPADRMGNAMDHHSRRSGMMHSMRHRSDAQDTSADHLNEQSYRAARNGQAFNGTSAGNGSGPMTTPNGPGTMDDLHGGSMSGRGHSGNAGDKM